MNRKLFFVLFILMISLAAAHEEDTFAMGEEIIKSKIPCSQLSEAQLEAVGEYYMEQMHPGELHEIMDARMGREGSEQLQQTHIAIAGTFYCGEHAIMSAGMMNTMMGRGGMMGTFTGRNQYNGMMSSLGYFMWWPPILLIAIIVIIIGIIVWLLLQKQKKRARK